MTFFPQRDLAPLRNTACFAFDYSPHFWLREQTHTPWQRFQSTFKRALTHRWLRCLPRWNFFVADERLHDPRLSELCAPCRDRYRFLPEIAPDHCPATNLNDRHGPRELLLVGGQNRRKGLADILAAMRHPEFPNDLKIRLVGRLGDDLQPLRAELQSLPPTRFLWEETFLSDAAIRERYRQCDYVAIPYTRQFQATSSVLAWAAAHGKPVLATDHGLVGFRVRQHQLGVHYPSGDITALVNTLKSLPHRNTPEYQRWSHAGSGYAQSCRLELFQNGLRHAVLGT